MTDATPNRRKLNAEDMQRMHVPEGLWRAQFRFVPASARAAVQNYLDKFDVMVEKGAGLLLWGGEGVGKSGTAAVIAKEARARGRTVFFVTVAELREAVRDRKPFDESMSVLDRCRDVDVLVLDNLLESDVNESFVNLTSIQDLLVGRGAKLKISILTTRISFAVFASKHDTFVRTITGYMVPIEITGPDLREKRGERLHDLVLGSEKDK